MKKTNHSQQDKNRKRMTNNLEDREVVATDDRNKTVDQESCDIIIQKIKEISK